jgi:hypothetical protein
VLTVRIKCAPAGAKHVGPRVVDLIRRAAPLPAQGDTPQAVRNLLLRPRDPAFTRVLVVTLAEATPVHGAERLQTDLRNAVMSQAQLELEVAVPAASS